MSGMRHGLETKEGRYKKGQRCRGCGHTKEERDALDYHAFHWNEQPAPSCTECDDGDRLTGRRLTQSPGQPSPDQPAPLRPAVCDEEGSCSLVPRSVRRSVRRLFGLGEGTRKRRGAKKRGTKKRRGTKKHGRKKRHGKKRRGSKKRGRSRKHRRGGNGCGSRKRTKRMRGGSNAHLSPMAINSELTRQQLAHVPPAGSGALAV